MSAAFTVVANVKITSLSVFRRDGLGLKPVIIYWSLSSRRAVSMAFTGIVFSHLGVDDHT
eukprot:scaffold31064_cov15-Prasinocladus_malaysianus.AAC.1